MSRLLKIGPRYHHAHSSVVPSKGYDQESGLCYSETIITGGSMTAGWIHRTHGHPQKPWKYRNKGPGCSSLRATAITVLLWNLASVTPETLEEVPWALVKDLWWNCIVTLNLDSLHIWKTFASTYPQEFGNLPAHKIEVLASNGMKPTDYFMHLTSPSYRWITFLTLSNIMCSRVELVQLSKLTNLGVLTIGEGLKAPDIGVDDSIIRAWMRAITESNAFNVLRILNFLSQRQVTNAAFQYFARFPLLTMVNLKDCGIGQHNKSEALRLGWEHKTGKDLKEFLANVEGNGHNFQSIYFAGSHWGENVNVRPSAKPALGVDDPHQLPVLDCSLGRRIDFSWDIARKRTWISFHRLKPSKLINEAAVPSKRPDEDDSHSSGPSRKKPAMRASKQQDLGNALMGFRS